MAIGERRVSTKRATRVEFAITSGEYLFVEVERKSDGTIFLEEFLPRGDGSYAEFFCVTGVSPDEVAAVGDAQGVDTDVFARYDDGGIVEFVVDDRCPAVFLAKQGALPRDVYGEGSEGRIVVEIPSDVETAQIVDRFLERYPSARLVTKRADQTATPTLNRRAFQRLLEERLTLRQQQVLASAFEAGYYEWPRRATADELADDLGISAPTFHKHLRRAESKLVEALFETPSANFTGASGE